MSHAKPSKDNDKIYPIKRINALKMIAFLLALAGIGLLAWDTAHGCTHHCAWSFRCLFSGAILMFIAWITELYHAETPYPGH